SGTTRGGGVFIAVKKRLKSKLVPIAAPSLIFEHVFVSVQLPGASLLLGCTYINPSSSLDIYAEHCTVVDQLRENHPNSHLILAGDYNLKTAVWKSGEDGVMEVECSSACALSLAAGNVCESFNSLSLRQLNPLPNEHGVFLDLVFSDLLDVRFSEAVDLLFDNNFHHNAVYFEFPAIKSIQVLTEDTLIYDFDKCNVSELRTYLRRVDWQSIFSDDINSSVESFYKILLAGIELSTPHRIIRSSSFPRWFSGDLRRLTFEKKKAHLVYKRTNLQSDYDRFSSLRAQCCLLRDSCYNAYMGKINNQLKSNPRSFWRFSEETRKVSGFPGQETADLFAESFSSAYKESGLPIPDYPFWDVIDFGDIALSEAEVLRTLSSLPSKFSSGPDKVPPYILKVCSSVLSLPLSIIFNKSLSSGVFPSAWKVSFILPIFKSGNRCDIANYRGVCIQSTIPKVLDKILCNKLSFACKRFISNYQHGFAHQRSTVTNLLSYQHDIL
ncbi:hypothetical protein WDU94_010912, partial [Cyamophila willieti]